MNVNNYKIDKDFILNELKLLGIKCTKKKEKNKVPEKLTRKRIFKTHLHLLELTDVVLANGEVVQIPTFVSEFCQRILEEVDTEGLFRKAGSTSRQKQIRANVEAGLQLDKNYQVIDVANVLKSFFRELPEPLLPPYIQEMLLRSYLIVEGKLNAILLTCLLLPPLTINTLAYFMQFLSTIALHEDNNRMSIGNLAIIFTPSLMPFNDLTSIRFNNHIKIVELLMHHSSSIGFLPDYLISKLPQDSLTSSAPIAEKSTDGDKRKKKRRSGSLTRMFNGIKKMVGAIGSSENLECNLETVSNVSTPFINKSLKKRKLAENDLGFSDKKKNDIRGLLPNGSLLPNTPAGKKSRVSLGDKRNATNNVERRWSIVGSAWTKKKLQSFANQKSNHVLQPLSPVVSLPNLPKMELDCETNTLNSNQSISGLSPDSTNNKSPELDYLKISKKEYEEIKGRVALIEKRISQEFDEINLMLGEEKENESEKMDKFMSGPEKVINKFEQINDVTTSHQMSPSVALANKLSRDLKIRRSDKIIRSPSARKIGSIRRRSRENNKQTRDNIRVTRTASWHAATSYKSACLNRNGQSYISSVNFYPKGNLKRGRPNTVQTGLLLKSNENDKKNECENINKFVQNEKWTSGEIFFKENIDIETPGSSSELSNRKTNSVLCTPEKFMTIDDGIKTPMLPPKSIPQKPYFKTPRTSERLTTKPKSALRKFKESSNDTDLNGRASIARLRALNAGQVMAKAKLFDNLKDNYDAVSNIPQINASAKISSAELRRRSALFLAKSSDKPIISNSSKSIKVQRNEKITVLPTNKLTNKSPGRIQKKRHMIGTKYPNKKILSEIVLPEEFLSPKKITTPKLNKFHNINCNSNLTNSPRKPYEFTPKIKKDLKINSPRKILKTPKCGKTRTPLKATPILRSSPRFTLPT